MSGAEHVVFGNVPSHIAPPQHGVPLITHAYPSLMHESATRGAFVANALVGANKREIMPTSNKSLRCIVHPPLTAAAGERIASTRDEDIDTHQFVLGA